MIDRCLAVIACSLCLAGSFQAVRGQTATARADASARTVSSLERTQTAPTEISADMSLAQAAEAELGKQELVRPKPLWLAPYVIGSAGLNYTSNPALARNGGRGDVYFVEGGGAGIRPNLIGGLYLDGHVSDQAFQYAQFSSLNFNYFNVGGGLDYVVQSWGVTASVRFEYQRFLDGEALDEFYVNHALTVALYKQFKLSDSMTIQAGWLSSFVLNAQPSSAGRNEYNFWLGWRWKIAAPLELQAYYLLSLSHYPQDSRLDATQNVGGALTLSLARWARLSMNTGFAANNSSDASFNYTVVNVGGALALDFRF